MAAELQLESLASQDIEDAYSWDESCRIGLGEEFLTALDAMIQSIRRMPELYGLEYKHYRRGLLRRFPYSVLYEYDGATVTVHCVFHCSRDSDSWQQRLR